MKIAIIGFDRQGRSAYDYWSTPDNEITICDYNKAVDAPAEADTQLGENYLDDLSRFDLIVRTPGLHPHQIEDATPDDPNILDKVTTVTNEFMAICPTKNIIGVTGTKGKGTTSTIIAEMLHAAGKRVHLGGNIGIAPLDLLQGVGLLHKTDADVEQSIQSEDWVVLELANFQLIDLRYSPHIGVCLMLAPEHLDWHEDLDEYLRSKQQLFAHQTEKDIAIYNPENNRSKHIATSSQGATVPYLTPPGAYIEDNQVKVAGEIICDTDEVPLPGAHNLENICAAITAVWQVSPNKTALAAAIKNLKSLPHRLELVAEARGVRFYNDSLGTTPETAIAAIRAMDRPTIIILGGSDKGAEFDELAKEISRSESVKHVVLIGKTGPAIEQALSHIYYDSVSYGGDTMAEVVKTAYSHAESGDAVLLAPACASFDMFHDYADRGDQFSLAAKALARAD